MSVEDMRRNARARLNAIHRGSSERFPGEARIAEMAVRHVDRADVMAHGGALTRCFAEIRREPLQWLWASRIPSRKITLVIGDPGLGKSLVTADIAARLSRGMIFPDGAACECGGTVMLSAEDDPGDTIRPRLDAAGADVSRIHLLEAVRVPLSDGSTSEKVFSLETDIGHLDAAMERLTGVRLLIVDPLSAYLGAADSHSNAEIRGLLAPLAAMAAQRGVAVIAVTHLRKSPGAAVHRAIGSIAFAAAARAVWAIAPDPEQENRRLMVPVKQNLSPPVSGLAFCIEAPDGIARIAWEPGGVTMSADYVLGENVTRDSGGALAEAREWLADALAHGPVAAKKIQRESKEVGIATITLRRAAESLRVEKRKGAFSGGWEWQFPENARREGAQPLPSQVSTFEQAIEKPDTNSSAGQEGAHGMDVSTFGEGDDEVRV